MNNILFVIKTFLIISRESIYFLFRRPKIECFINIVTHLGKLNIFYIKIFQSLSTNSHLLNEEQIDYLTKYTDKVPYTLDELDYSFIESIHIQSNKLNHNFELDIVNNTIIPYKAGMIAIVYTGKINNKKVIIKVIRNNIEQKLKLALKQMNFLINILVCIPYVKRFNLKNLILENEKQLLSQIDFMNEVKNIQRMYNNCKNTDYIEIPYVYDEYTNNNNNIIVMDYIDGEKLESVIDLDKDNYSLLVAKFGIKCLLFNRFYHGDLHSGNILFIKDNENNYKLGILDFGVCGEITKCEQNEFFNLFVLIGKTEDYLDVAEFIVNNLVEPKSAVQSLNEKQLKYIIAKLANISKKTFSNIGFGVSELYEISYLLSHYNLTLTRNFCRIELSLAIANSVTSKLSYKTSYIKNIKSILGDIPLIF